MIAAACFHPEEIYMSLGGTVVFTTELNGEGHVLEELLRGVDLLLVSLHLFDRLVEVLHLALELCLFCFRGTVVKQ